MWCSDLTWWCKTKKNNDSLNADLKMFHGKFPVSGTWSRTSIHKTSNGWLFSICQLTGPIPSSWDWYVMGYRPRVLWILVWSLEVQATCWPSFIGSIWLASHFDWALAIVGLLNSIDHALCDRRKEMVLLEPSSHRWAYLYPSAVSSGCGNGMLPICKWFTYWKIFIFTDFLLQTVLDRQAVMAARQHLLLISGISGGRMRLCGRHVVGCHGKLSSWEMCTLAPCGSYQKNIKEPQVQHHWV